MGTARRGRPKGARNKVTNDAKQAVLMAFDALGGFQRLVDWVKADPANETLYWTKIFPRLLPRPAADEPPAPEALPPVRGALIFKTPDWAKRAMKESSRGKAALASGTAGAATAVAEAAGGTEPGPLDGGRPPTGWVAPG